MQIVQNPSFRKMELSVKYLKAQEITWWDSIENT